MRFGVYEADLEAGELRKSGRKINLQEQPFQVLAQLLAHPGKLVTREELQKRIWPADTFVDFDLGLNTTIKKIRAALGDSADSPKFIETLPKRGYRFIYPMEEITSSETSATPNGSMSMIAADAIPAPVIPEANQTTPAVPTKGHYRRWLASGVLVTISLLAGFILIRQHDRTRQNRASHPIQSAADERFENHGTRDPAALASYEKGMALLQTYDMPQQYDKAIESFEQAIKADPSYAAAYGELSVAEWKKFDITRQDQLEVKAEVDCNRSRDLDDQQPAAFICQGVIHQARGNFGSALSNFSTAIGIASHSPNAGRDRAAAYRGHGVAYRSLGRIQEAKEDFLQAIQAVPGDWRSHSILAKLYFDNAEYDEAIQQNLEVIRITPANSKPFSDMGSSYMFKGQWKEAVVAFKKAIELRPTSGEAHNNLAYCRLYAGDFEEAIAAFQEAVKLDSGNYVVYGNLARAYSWKGQTELATGNYLHAIQLAESKRSQHEDQDAILMLAVYHAMLGHKDNADNYLRLAEQKQANHHELAFWLGVVNLKLGNQAKALAWLKQAHELGYSSAEIDAALELDSLRTNPEFLQIVSAAKPNVNRRSQ